MSNTDFGATVIAIGAWIAGAALAGALAWIHAPPVGGEWWPYVRFGVTVIAAFVGGKLGIILAFVGIVGFVGLLTILDEVVLR